MAAKRFEEENVSFLAWLEHRGATISPSIRITDYRTEGRGRGVAATKDIAEDETLFTIPRSATLLPSTSAIDKDLLEQLVDSEGQQDPWLSLILAMCAEHMLGQSSTWSPYLDILPTAFDTPIFWSSEELDELQASPLRTRIGKKSADEQFKTRIVPLLGQLPGTERLQDDTEKVALCHRMASTIMAYAFDIEPASSAQVPDADGYISDDELDSLPKGMVPLADLLNADGARNNARLFYEDEVLTMKSLSPIAAGDEIFNDYGELPRSDLLRRYGYVTPEYAAFDVAELSCDLILAAVKERPMWKYSDPKKRLAFLEEHEVLEESYDIGRADTTPPEPGYDRLLSQLPNELLVVLHTMLLPPKGFENYYQMGKLPKIPRPNSTDQPITDVMATVLREVIVKRLAEYSTSLATDLEHRKDQTFDGDMRTDKRKAMALEVRIGEKEILADVEASLSHILKPSDEASESSAEDNDGSKDREIKRLKTEA